MPIIKRTVTPEEISRVPVPKGITNELDCITNSTLSNIIRQLSSLSKHVEDTFGELYNEADATFRRTSQLQDRIERLRFKVTQLDSTAEEVSVIDIHMRKPFRSSVVTDREVLKRESLPPCMLETYTMCDKPPALDKLDAYREDGKSSMKFYTDPNYFFDLWRQEMEEHSKPKKQMKKKGGRQHQPHHRPPKIKEAKRSDYTGLKDGIEFKPDKRSQSQQVVQQGQNAYDDQKVPSRPNSLELDPPQMSQISNNERYAENQAYLQQQQQHQQQQHYVNQVPEYSNGPVQYRNHPTDQMNQTAPHYRAPPPYSHNNDVINMNTPPQPEYINNQPMMQAVVDKRVSSAGSRVSGLPSPRPSQPPPPVPHQESTPSPASGSPARRTVQGLPPPPVPPTAHQNGQVNNVPYMAKNHNQSPGLMRKEIMLQGNKIGLPGQGDGRLSHPTQNRTPENQVLPPPPPPPVDMHMPGTPLSTGSMPTPPPSPPPDMSYGPMVKAPSPPPPLPPPPPPPPKADNNIGLSGLHAPLANADNVSYSSEASSMTNVSEKSRNSEESATEAKSGMSDRSDLLRAIKEGIKLRKVEKKAQEEQQSRNQPDVEAIIREMEKRREHLNDSDDSDSMEEGWDDSE